MQAQQAGVQASFSFDAGEEVERSALLSVESLKKSLTPEGYIAWARAVDLLPSPLATDSARGGEEVAALAYSPDVRRLVVRDESAPRRGFLTVKRTYVWDTGDGASSPAGPKPTRAEDRTGRSLRERPAWRRWPAPT